MRPLLAGQCRVVSPETRDTHKRSQDRSACMCMCVYLSRHSTTYVYEYVTIMTKRRLWTWEWGRGHGRGSREGSWGGLEGGKRRGKGCASISIKNIFKKPHSYCLCAYVQVVVHMCVLMPMEVRKEHQVSWGRNYKLWSAWYSCWELSLGSLKEQCVLSITEPSLQLRRKASCSLV